MNMGQTEAQRLLNVSTALRESPIPVKDFTMKKYGNECGSPACALGHYAVRHDLQQKFNLDEWGDLAYSRGTKDMADYDDEEIHSYFGITGDESSLLFSGLGCDQAKTPLQAAQFIERFLREKGWTF